MPGDFVGELADRGLLHQTTDPTLRDRMQQEVFTGYIGFDPTAASLHVGSLLQILGLVRLQRAGHRPIAIVGGGTGLIGDPSGKSAERSMLTREKLDENVRGIRSQLERFLDFSGPDGALLINNADWLCELNLMDFLRDVGKHFSVNQMVVRDSVKLRLESREQGISYTEFSYALLQAFDFLELFDRHGCRLQIGGSDQWGNIVDGTDLIRRVRGETAFGVTQPLITRADGSKFGKTESGNVWLDETLTRPFTFHQFWLNAADSDVGRYLRFFTFLSREEIESLERTIVDDPGRRAAQWRLADEVTRLVHGSDVVPKIKNATAALFEGGDLFSLDVAALEVAMDAVNRVRIDADRLGTPEASLVALLVESGLATSRGEARRAIESGGISVNQRVHKDPHHVLNRDDLLAGAFLVLRRGKKTYCALDARPDEP